MPLPNNSATENQVLPAAAAAAVVVDVVVVVVVIVVFSLSAPALLSSVYHSESLS